MEVRAGPRRGGPAVPPQGAADRRAEAAEVPPEVRLEPAARERAEAQAPAQPGEPPEREEPVAAPGREGPREPAGAVAPRVPERPALPEKVAPTAAPDLQVGPAAQARATPVEKAEARPTAEETPEMAALDSASS